MKRNYFQNFDHEKCAIYLLPVRPLTLRCAYSPHLLYHYTIFLKILMGTHFLEIFKLFFLESLKISCYNVWNKVFVFQIRRRLLIFCCYWSSCLIFAFNHTEKQFSREYPNLKMGNKEKWNCLLWYTGSLHYCVNCINFLHNDHTLWTLVNQLIILTRNSAENTPNSKIKCETMEYEITFRLKNVYHTIQYKESLYWFDNNSHHIFSWKTVLMKIEQ